MDTATGMMGLAVVLQCTAAFFAVRLMRSTLQHLAWQCIAVAISLMAVQQGMTVCGVLFGAAPTRTNLLPALLGLGVSACLAIGMGRIGRIVQDLHAAQDILRESESRYQTLVENSIQGMLIHQDGRIRAANRAVAAMFGYSHPAVLLGQDIYILLAPHEVARLQAYNAARLRGEDVATHYEAQGKRQDATIVWLEILASLWTWANQPAVLITLLDITARKEAEAERGRLIADLETRNAEMERFTYTVSHDLKSPLITIQGFLDVVEQGFTAAEHERVGRDFAYIRNAAHSMQHLLDDLLELSRIGRVVHPPQMVALDALVQEALGLVNGQLKARGVQVEIAAALPRVFCDRSRLIQVFQNLFDNAIKFMGEQPAPRIVIGARQDKAATLCYVRDNGIGIEPPYHLKVFGLFQRLAVSDNGTGVGLTLVQRIIEIHGGRVWVESPGRNGGSTFYFTLPQPQEHTSASDFSVR